MTTRNNLVILIVVVVAAAVLRISAAATYTVGGSLGWQDPPGGAVVYSTWAARYTFTVGDILVFNFTTGDHTAAKVTNDAFNSCNTTNPLTIQTTGPASYTLDATGEDYFICTISNHCSLGQKLQVNVTSGPGSPNSSPSPGSSPPPPPSGTTMAPPPPNSAAPTVIAAITLNLVAIAIAFVC
ncbi:unnamed protein product [Ilex paraguariensis]|uniref:Phytocyanin domain-containing protein n=1 Tax=Ilex paraguariensis TaxID=185542 RepID=A0ABC8TSZ3_9AQUA